MKRILLMFVALFVFTTSFATGIKDTYKLGFALGKASQKDLKDMGKSFNEEDFLTAIKNTMFDKNPGEIKDEDSYDTGEFIAKQYLDRLGDLSDSKKKDFIDGYTDGIDSGSAKLTKEERTVLKQFDNNDESDNDNE